MTTYEAHQSDEKYKQYPLFPEYFVEMKKKVAEEKKSVEIDELAVKVHLMHFGESTHTKRGYPKWGRHGAKKLLQDDVAAGKHKTMPPRELRMTKPEYQEFPGHVFTKRVNGEKSKQLSAAFWADKRNKKGMKKYLQEVAAKANE